MFVNALKMALADFAKTKTLEVDIESSPDRLVHRECQFMSGLWSIWMMASATSI